VQSCPQNALAKKNNHIHIEASKCQLVGECAKVCPTLALEKIGYKLTVAEAMAVIEKDRVFQETSQGGATFSGGEPLMQPEFLDALLDACRQRGIHTIVDTSGHAPYEIMDRIREKVDLFFYDLKLMDEDKHQEMAGVSNRLILDNLKKLAQTGSKIQIRIPLIPGVNTTPEEITGMADFISLLPGIDEISLLPYHNLGGQKYENLNRPISHPQAQVPSEKDIKEIRSQLEPYGFGIRIGG